jgi:hypothetical protein
MKKNKINRVIPTETISIKKQFYDNKTKKNVTYNKLVKPISSEVRKQSIKKLGELRDEVTTDFNSRDVIYDTEVVKHSRYKKKKSKLKVDVYTDSTNHKLVRLSEVSFNSSSYEYFISNTISIPIKDFKKMLKELNNSL